MLRGCTTCDVRAGMEYRGYSGRSLPQEPDRRRLRLASPPFMRVTSCIQVMSCSVRKGVDHECFDPTRWIFPIRPALGAGANGKAERPQLFLRVHAVAAGTAACHVAYAGAALAGHGGGAGPTMA